MLHLTNDRSRLHRCLVTGVAFLCVSTTSSIASDHGNAHKHGSETTGIDVIFKSPLADVPGNDLVVVKLTFAPNPAPPSTAERHPVGHRHPGSVYVHVTKGTLRLAIEGHPVEIVQAGESFFEPPGVLHTIAENASTTESAVAIAVMIVPEGAPLVLPAD